MSSGDGRWFKGLVRRGDSITPVPCRNLAMVKLHSTQYTVDPSQSRLPELEHDGLGCGFVALEGNLAFFLLLLPLQSKRFGPGSSMGGSDSKVPPFVRITVFFMDERGSQVAPGGHNFQVCGGCAGSLGIQNTLGMTKSFEALQRQGRNEESLRLGSTSPGHPRHLLEAVAGPRLTSSQCSRSTGFITFSAIGYQNTASVLQRQPPRWPTRAPSSAPRRPGEARPEETTPEANSGILK